jgi:hypothetical protein
MGPADADAEGPESEDGEELDDEVDIGQPVDDEADHPDENENELDEDKPGDEGEDDVEEIVDGGEDDNYPLDFETALDFVCDHLEQTRTGSRGDRLSAFDRYERARDEAERIVERIWMAVGERPDDEEEESDDGELDDDDAEFARLGI